MNRSWFVPTLLVASVAALSGCATGGGAAEEEGEVDSALRDTEYTRSAELFLTQGETLGTIDRFPQALEAAMSEISNDPGNAVGYFQAARAQIGLLNFVAADTLLEMALVLHPGYQEDVDYRRESAWIVAFNASIGFMDADSMEGVLEVLESAEMIFPEKRPEALLNLGVTYSQLGRAEDAIEAFGAALEVLRGPRPDLYRQRGTPDDSAMVRSWLEEEQGMAFNRALLLGEQGRYGEAADEYQAYLERHPGHMSALSNMAASLSAAGMPDSAQAIYDGLLKGEGLGIREYFNIGVGLYLAEDFVRAAEAFREVVEKSPDNRDALLNLTTSLLEAGEYEECVPAARELVDLDGYDQGNYMFLARCLAETGDDMEAGRVVQAGQNLRFMISDAGLDLRAGGGGTVTATLTNKTLEPGTTITIRVHFSGDDGETVGTSSLRVEAPEQGAAEPFTAELASDEEVMGYYFQVIPPRR